MNHNSIIFASGIRVILLLLVFSQGLPATAQSQSGQQRNSAQSKASGDKDADVIDADRPGIADGSAVIGANRFQLEAGFQEEFRHQQKTREYTLFIPALLRIGINSHWEARVEGNTFATRTDRDSMEVSHHNNGFAPLSFGLKYQFEESNGVKHPALGATLRIFPVYGTSDFRTHHLTGDFRLAADWDFAPRLKLSLNPNAGVGVYEDEHGKRFVAGELAVTLDYLPVKKLNPFIDFGLLAPEEKGGTTAVIVDAGVAYILGRDVQLDASVGTGAKGHVPPHPFVSCGISFRSKVVRHRK